MKNLINEQPSVKLSGRLKKTFEFVNPKDIAGKSLLDVGCGYGWFEYNALKKGAKKIAGIEVSDVDLETIRRHIKSEMFSSKVGSAIKIPYQPSSFDTVAAWEVIEHIPRGSENLFFSEVRR